MSDDARLLAGEADDFEAQLLRSWDAEQPSDHARARALAILGAGVGAIATSAAIGAKAGVGAMPIAPKAAGLGTASLAKWAIVAIVGAATAGTAIRYLRHASHGDATIVSAPAVKAPPASEATPSLPLAQPAPRGAEVTAQTSDEAPARPASPSHHASAGTKADPSLGEEVAALDRARRAMSQGDASEALRRLDDYEARFPRGALGEEAEVTRVEALLAEGDRNAAARVGNRFLAAHPASPHAARVRALLDQAPAP